MRPISWRRNTDSFRDCVEGTMQRIRWCLTGEPGGGRLIKRRPLNDAEKPRHKILERHLNPINTHGWG